MSNYVTVAELKAFKDRNGVVYDLANFTDPEIQEALDEAEGLIERVTGSRFYVKAETYRFDGLEGERLFFAPRCMYPLVSLGDGGGVWEVDENDNVLTTFVEGDDFINRGHFLELMVAESDRIRRRLSVIQGYWGTGRSNIKVTGNWGLATPAPIKRVTKLLSVETLKPGSTHLSPRDVSQQSWPDYTVSFRGGGEKKAITGFVEVDRILSSYVNYAALFLRQGESSSSAGVV